MSRSLIPFLLAAAVLMGLGCDEQTVGPALTPEYDSPSRSVVPTGTPLAVHIQGQSKARWETHIPLKASVSGGVGPYYYTWEAYVCFDEGSRCHGPTRHAYGVGVDSMSFYVYEEMWSVEIGVSVEDTQGNNVNGVASLYIEGPPQTDAPREGDGDFQHLLSCNEEPNFFPFLDVDMSGTEPQYRHYARNWCTFEKIYNKCSNHPWGGICPNNTGNLDSFVEVAHLVNHRNSTKSFLPNWKQFVNSNVCTGDEYNLVQAKRYTRALMGPPVKV